MRQIDQFTKKDAVAERIRSEIIAGRLRPGMQLLQQEMAERLGVSSTPVREAFGLLEAEGFLVRRPHRGVTVAERDYKAVEENYELRIALEQIAVKRVSQAHKKESLAELQRILSKGSHAMTSPNLHRFREAALEFHEALAVQSGSSALAELLGLLRARTVFHPPLGRDGVSRVQRSHERIVAAIRSSDVDEAVARLTRHLLWNLDVARVAEARHRADGEAVAPAPDVRGVRLAR